MPVPRRARLSRGRQFSGIHPLWVSLLLAAALLGLFLSTMNARMRPLLRAMAVSQVSNAVTGAVNDAVASGIVSNHISYNDMVNISMDASGHVTMLASNLEQINLLRSELLALVLDEVDELTVNDFSIPLGNLTEIDLLAGWGPSITVQAISTGAANASFEHEFTSEGVNQTLHQVLLSVDVTMQILLPGETLEAPVSTQVCVAETIIVGEVPATYLQLEQ